MYLYILIYMACLLFVPNTILQSNPLLPPSPPDEPEESDYMHDGQESTCAIDEDEYDAQTLRLSALEEELRGLAPRGGSWREGGMGRWGGDGGVGGKYYALRVPYIYIDILMYLLMYICICLYLYKYAQTNIFVHGLASTIYLVSMDPSLRPTQPQRATAEGPGGLESIKA